MDESQVGNNAVSACPWCDKLLSVKISNDDQWLGALDKLYTDHLDTSPQCREVKDSQPSVWDQFAAMRPDFEKADEERQKRIHNHQDNGKVGWWRVQGVRHDGIARASSAEEAVRKCVEADIVGDWESAEARFFCKELPEAF